VSKKVYLEPAWKLPVSYEHLIAFPPDGYEFVAPQQRERLFRSASRWSQSYDLLNSLDSLLPTVLAMSRLKRWSKPPPGTALTWAHGHLVFRPEPWVVEVEYASLLLGPNPKHLKRYRHTLERALASPYCRAIRCWSEAGRRTLTTGLDCQGFEHKIKLVHLAVPSKSFVKEPESGRVRLLFVGSANIKGQFEGKGGREVLEAFTLLHQRYPNLELVIRSDVPASLKASYSGIENIRFIDEVVPAEVLAQEYRSADIFILPSHSTPPYTILDAMSYELPVVSIDAWANPELVEDGKTGLLVERPRKVPYYEDTCHPTFGTAEFNEAVRKPDSTVIEGLVKRVSLLIESPELRRRLGKAGRWEVEHGRFSIPTRNDRLKRIFDEAIV
jgi:glycosyltransferase involved in cell wall biosynthesis